MMDSVGGTGRLAQAHSLSGPRLREGEGRGEVGTAQISRIRLTCYVRFSVDRRLAFSFYGQDTW
jgi:hypothetical protein